MQKILTPSVCTFTTQKTKQNKSLRRLISMAIVSLIALSGCAENDVSDLDTFVTDIKIKYKGQVEVLPVISPYESYYYGLSHSRDPFKPSVSLVKEATIKRSSSGLRPNEIRNKEGLEKYSLQSLVMVGLMNNNGQNWAIVKAPDNSIFRVRKGNYMGENNGKITRISESGINLKEIVPDGRGGWFKRKNKLTLTE